MIHSDRHRIYESKTYTWLNNIDYYGFKSRTQNLLHISMIKVKGILNEWYCVCVCFFFFASSLQFQYLFSLSYQVSILLWVSYRSGLIHIESLGDLHIRRNPWNREDVYLKETKRYVHHFLPKYSKRTKLRGIGTKSLEFKFNKLSFFFLWLTRSNKILDQKHPVQRWTLVYSIPVISVPIDATCINISRWGHTQP